VVHLPGAGAQRTLSSATLPMPNIDFLLLSGRAVLYPVVKGTFERRLSVTPAASTLARRDWVIQVINDIRRSVDFLKTRSDISGDSLAYYGLSWGAARGANVLALESRFKAAVLLVGGYFLPRVLPEVEQLHFAPRVKLPVLMINAETDLTFPLETSQKPMFAHLGTPREHKRHVLFPGGHDIIIQRRSQVVKEALDWLDRYLGPVPH
jgi:dienelactone hydrolase